MAKPLASRFQTEDHSNLHLFESILAPNSYYDDKDYEAISRRNYLDPNYMPVWRLQINRLMNQNTKELWNNKF